MSKTNWLMADRFGLVIHWGLYAIPARGEWVRNNESISNEDYQKYFDAFNPSDYNPRNWAKVAKDAGIKYAVMTAKHHDGFCLFDSKLTDYNATKTPCGRDLIREFIDAFRAEDLKVGVYYSLLDWHHPDYPHFGHMHHPMRWNEAYKGKRHDFNSYVAYLHGQIEELLTNYGKIDLLFFDFCYEDLYGEAWKATELIRMIRRLQPDILVNNRLGASYSEFGSLITDSPTEFAGDYISPESVIPPNGIWNDRNEPLPWEANLTMNNTWGYNELDRDFKPYDMIVRYLVECVSKGGNLLLNVGPDANGRIPGENLSVLAEIGKWMRLNGESIYGCGYSGMGKPEYGRITRKGNILYYHITEAQAFAFPLVGLKRGQVKRAWLVRSGAEMPIFNSGVIQNEAYRDLAFVSFGASPYMPDPVDTVIGVEIL